MLRGTLLYVLLPVLVVWILSNTYVGLVLYTCANIIRPEMFFWGGNQGAIVFKVFIGAAMISFLRNPGGRLTSAFGCRDFWLIIWIWVALLVSIWFSPYPTNPMAYEFANEFLKLAVLLWLVLGLLHSEERIVHYERTMLGAFTFLAIWGVEQHFRGNERLEGLGGAAFGDSNGVAALLVLAFPLALNLALHSSEKRERWLGWGASAAILLAVIATQSRGGFLGLSVAAAVFFLHSRKKKQLILITSVLLTVAALFVTDGYLNRMSTITAEEEERDLSSGSRLVLWKAGMMIFRDNPIIGTGFLSFPLAKQEYQDAVPNVDEKLREYSFRGYKVSHNSYVQALSEGGLFLFVPYALLILGCLWGNRALRRAKRGQAEHRLMLLLNGIEAGIVGYCVCIVFINALTAVLLPVQIVVSRVIRDTLRQEEEAALPAVETARCEG